MKYLIIISLICLSLVKIEANSCVMFVDDGRVYVDDNMHEVRSVASISKIMTAILVIEQGILDDEIVVDDHVSTIEGSSLYLQVNDKIKVIDLLYGLMLRSGNDASYLLAKYISGSEAKFACLMNEKAKQIGMNNTCFNNASGLDDNKGNYSSSYDMALLMCYASQNKIFRQIINTKYYTSTNGFCWKNKHRLIFENKYFIGGKTGFTKQAKRTLVSLFKKDEQELIVVTLNESNDFYKHQQLAKQAFDHSQSIVVLPKGKYLVGSYEFYVYQDLKINILKNEKVKINSYVENKVLYVEISYGLQMRIYEYRLEAR